MQSCAGQPNYFVQKIWSSLVEEDTCIMEFIRYQEAHVTKFERLWDIDIELQDEDVIAKLHTIRAGNRWRPGMKIHMAINNRTKDFFQFAPVIECVSVQNVEIRKYRYNEQPGYNFSYCIQHGESKQPFNVLIDGLKLNRQEVMELAFNDGFGSPEKFFDFFNADFTGQLIHWTDFRY